MLGGGEGGREKTTRGLVAGRMAFSSCLLLHAARQARSSWIGHLTSLPSSSGVCRGALRQPSEAPTPCHDGLEGAIRAHMDSLHFIPVTQ